MEGAKYSVGQQLKLANGATGKVVTVWGSPGFLVYAVACDKTGEVLERFEQELQPVEPSETTKPLPGMEEGA